MTLLAANGIVCTLLGIYWAILFARVILSWIPRVPDGLRPVVDVIMLLTEPVVRLARPLIPPIRVGAVALDLSILLVFLLLGFLQRIACNAGL